MSDLSNQCGFGNDSSATLQQRKIVGTLTAQYDFEGEEERDLCFKAGQTIRVLKIREKDWWVGLTEDGQKGLFPINFMKRDEQLRRLTQVRSMRNKSWDCFR